MSSRLALLSLLLAGIALGLPLRPTTATPGATERVSVDQDGTQANGQSMGPSISADGRYVGFISQAPNLSSRETNALPTYHAFLKDRVTGELRRVSVKGDGGRSEGVNSVNVIHTAISDDGRFMAFNSFTRNPPSYASAAVYDRETGKTELIGGILLDLSGDGRFIALASGSADFLRDLDSGDLERLPMGARLPSLSYDARFVAHIDSKGRVAVLDRETGVSEVVGLNNAGEVIGLNNWPSISNDGRYVVFESQAPNIAAGDGPDTADIFVRDRLAGETILISRDGDGRPSGGFFPQISPDGRRIVYSSPYTVSAAAKLLVHDLGTGITEKVSVNSLGEDADAPVPSVTAAPQDISSDGRFIAFDSNATNLVPEDTNECGMGGGPGSCTDIFVHDRGPQPEAPSQPPFEPPGASPSPEPTTTIPTAPPCPSPTSAGFPSPAAPSDSPAPSPELAASPQPNAPGAGYFGPSASPLPQELSPTQLPESPTPSPSITTSPQSTPPTQAPESTAAASCEEPESDDIQEELETSLNVGRVAAVSATLAGAAVGLSALALTWRARRHR